MLNGCTILHWSLAGKLSRRFHSWCQGETEAPGPIECACMVLEFDEPASSETVFHALGGWSPVIKT